MFPLKNPLPNFEEFKEILLGKREPEKVHFIEVGIDIEIMNFLLEKISGEKIPTLSQANKEKNKFLYGRQGSLVST